MAKIPDVSLCVHLIEGEKLERGGVYLIRTPANLTPDQMMVVQLQLNEVHNVMGVDFILLSNAWEMVKPEEFFRQPKFAEAVTKIVDEHLNECGRQA